MAYTQADLDSLRASMKLGVRSSSVDGKTIQFHSLAEMMTLERKIQDELSPPVTSSGPRTSLTTYIRD